ncbi:PAS domain-containing methyl-accepting chemotaxis protein [Colwellia asteriadis]|uniref:PAS domain-containing methyl-accepting chemotaxis protein n=1 Tax=Colwellia asteriadis TaxID=517723 RepID=A0ABP3WJY0_9GAMM
MSLTTVQLISVTDLNGNYTYVNNDYCETTGYPEETLLNTDTRRLTHHKMPRLVLEELSSTLAQGLSWQGLLHIEGNNKQELWFDTFITPQYSHGKVIGYQSISTLAKPALITNAKHIYQALNNEQSWATFEFTKNHKFAFLILLSLIAQGFIYAYLGLAASIVAALSAITPILVFWSDIIPTAIRAKNIQNTFDSISRKVYFGKGTASVFDFTFSLLKTKIRAIIERTLDAAAPIKSVMNAVSQGLEQNRTTLAQQKHDLAQLSDAMEQMQTSTEDIAKNTVSAAYDLEKTFSQCEQSQDSIAQTTDKIKQLAHAVENASSSADSLTQSANSVGELMQEIQSIADQTNLLALNAAIEAARAGEHGRGFAVVAGEVRSLSSRTQESALKIHQRLTAMLDTIAQWVLLMNKNKEEANYCVESAEISHQRIDEVVNSMQNVNVAAMQISSAAEQQSMLSNEINDHLHGIAQTTETTWLETEKVSEQMHTLAQSVEEISDLASTFVPQINKG